MDAETGIRRQRRALDAAFEVAARQVTDGTAPFVILGVADARGMIRLESFSPPGDPPRPAVPSAPITTRSVCLLASITKPVVATAIMREVEAGRFDLSEPLADVLPKLGRSTMQPFSAWHVLSHTSGLADIDLEALVAAGADREALLDAMLEQPQETPPGTRFLYTSCTFDLLVEAVGRRLGRSFEEILRENVLDPLGMADTTFVPGPAQADRLAPIVVGGWDGMHRHAATHDERQLLDGFVGLRLAGGGLWSTATDLLRFGRAMLRAGELDDVRILSPAFVALMTREVTIRGLGAQPDPLEADHYALGWGKPGIADPGSPEAFYHGGVSGTRLWIDPASDLVYVYLTGVWGYDSRNIDAVGHAIYAMLP